MTEPWRRFPGIAWLVAAGVAFVAAELVFVSPRMGLSWDETVYVSQVSRHAPAAWFDPPRARGVPLLVAPLTWLTSSVVALRVYLAVLSGAAMLAALLVWRGLPGTGRDGRRQDQALVLAAAGFGGLWVTQYYGPQAMPDMWSALGALAASGFLVRYHTRGPARGSLWGLGGTVAFVTLTRPGDGVFLAVPMLILALWWRRWWPTAVIIAGLVAGGLEWVAEAMVRFGGVLARLRAAGAEQSGFGLHFALPDELKALNGPTLCRPCVIGYRQPELDVWWLLLPVLVILGTVVVARATGMTSVAVAPALIGACLAAQYLFMIDYAAPRFLLPAYAVLAVPVGDGLAWLCTGVRAELRPAMTALVSCLLAAQLVAQHFVLDHEAGGTVTFHDDYMVIARSLEAAGVRPPCVINGDQYIPIAFLAGCASAPSLSGGAGHGAVLVRDGYQAPWYARHWRSYRIAGTRVLHVTAYVHR